MDDDFHAPLFTEDETDKAVVTLLGMSFNERMKLVKDARIRVRGVSGKVMKMSNFNKLMQIVNVIGNMPKVANAVDPTKFVRRIFESFDEAPEDLLNMEMIENVNQPEGTVPETPPQGPAMPDMSGGLNGQGPASPQGDEAQQQLEEVLRNVRRNQRQQ